MPSQPTYPSDMANDAPLAPEDAKLVTLARATRARTGAAQGAAVRDLDGRTYAGATVALATLELSALQVCVAMAVASGAKGLEAAVILGDGDAVRDLLVVGDFTGPGVPVHLGDAAGKLTQVLAS